MRRVYNALFVCLLLLFFKLPVQAQSYSYNGICESGNTAVTIPGTQGSGVQRFQRSFPSCTVTVYLAGTVSLATIYSDNNSTALGNPFTAQLAGRFTFYALDGYYDVKLSGGGIPAPFTIGNVWLGGIPVNCAGLTGNGTAWDARLNTCLTALGSTGGIADMRAVTGSQTCTSAISISNSNITIFIGRITLTSSSGCQILFATGVHDVSIIGEGAGSLEIGTGTGATQINHSAASYFIDTPSNAQVDTIRIEGVNIATSSTSTSSGCIRAKRSTDAYNSNNFLHDWNIAHVNCKGPGAANAGLIGMSLTQVARMLMTQTHVNNYETSLAMYADTESTLVEVTLDGCLNGFLHSYNSGFTTGAGTQSRFYSLTIHGPASGTTGVGLDEQLSGNQYFGLYVEAGVSTITAMTRLGPTARFNKFFGSRYDATGGAPTNCFVFTAGAARNEFHGDFLNLSAGSCAVTMGAPSGTGTIANVWFNPDGNTITALATPVANGYAAWCGNSAGGYGMRCAPSLGINVDPTPGTGVLEVGNTAIFDAGITVASTATALLYKTNTNCASAGGTCVAATAGAVTIAAAVTTVTVATTTVSANSQIIITEDSSLGTRLGVTCNTTTGRTYSVTSRSAAASFVITSSAAPAANPACLNYLVVN